MVEVTLLLTNRNYAALSRRPGTHSSCLACRSSLKLSHHGRVFESELGTRLCTIL